MLPRHELFLHGNFPWQTRKEPFPTRITLLPDGKNVIRAGININNAFVDLPIPVMVIPALVPYREVKKIAFACNYYRKNLHVPVAVIRKLLSC